MTYAEAYVEEDVMTERRRMQEEGHETAIVAAWREQLAEAAENPWLADLLLRYGDRILGRFIAFYQRLRRLSHKTLWRMRRKLGLSLGSAALLLAVSGSWTSVVRAGEITVDGSCSLADAITAANTDSDVGGCSGAAGTDVLRVTDDISLTTGLPAITSTVTISANHHTIRRDPGSASDFSVLEVSGNGRLTLHSATISGGRSRSYCGGGIRSFGTLTITGSTIAENVTYGLGGGGVCSVAENGRAELLISDSIISGNTAISTTAGTGYAGGVLNYGYYAGEATARITGGSVISGNTAENSGGGVFNLASEGTAQLTIEDSHVSGNDAERLGGGANNRALYGGVAGLIVHNSVISGNIAYGGGGSSFYGAPYGGGGLANYGALYGVSEARVEGCLVEGNLGVFGGGVFNLGYYGIANLRVRDTIISGNGAFWGGGVENLAVGEALLFDSNSPEQETISSQGDGEGSRSTGTRLERRPERGAGAMTDIRPNRQTTQRLSRPRIWRMGRAFLSAQREMPGRPPRVTKPRDSDAIENDLSSSSARVSIESSVITGNVAFLGTGGGLSNHALFSGTAGITISEATIMSNTADYGGGLANEGVEGGRAEVLAEKTTVSENLAYSFGGGLFNRAQGYEEGEACEEGIGLVTLRNCTVSGNAADGWGGGVENWAESVSESIVASCATGQVRVEHSTVFGNKATLGGGISNYDYYGTAQTDLMYSIISGNEAALAGDEMYDYCYRPDVPGAACAGIGADEYNLFGHAGESDYDAFAHTFTPTAGSDIKATSSGRNVPLGHILDQVLQNNGGRTETHALVFGSPAVDAGDPNFSPSPIYDQRGPGYPRVINGRIDIGAYEYRPVPVGGVTVGGSRFGPIISWSRLLLAGLTATLGALVAALRRR